MSTFVIAECGSCHDGVYEKAVGLIDVARDAGADVAKFQYWSSAKRLAERRNAAAYLPTYEQYAMPTSWLPRLAAECRSRGLKFMCTSYLPEDIEVVAPHVSSFKIASFEARDLAFVSAHQPYGKPVIVSHGIGHSQPYVGGVNLHCISAYPAPLAQANLASIRAHGYDGFSDHTGEVLTGAFAVCAGARVLEVHIKDWMTAKTNPDATTALAPTAFVEYVRLVRLAETMMGPGNRVAMPCETAMAAYEARP